MSLYHIDDGFACGGVVVKNGKVVYTAPIFRWMMRRTWRVLRTELVARGCKVRRCKGRWEPRASVRDS